jgi:stage III sporulation protein AE
MRRAVLALIIFVLLSAPCFAVSQNEEYRLYGAEELQEAVPEEARKAVGDISLKDAADPQGLLSRIWSALTDDAVDALSSGIKSAVSVLAIVMLCSAAATFFDGGNIQEYVTLAGCLGISACTVGGVRTLIGSGSAALSQLKDFSNILLPTLCTAAVSGGAVTSAAAKYAAASMFIDILINAADDFIVPLIYAYIALVIVGAALGGRAVKSAAKLLKWLCVTFMTAVTAVFTAYIGITGAVTGSTDAAAVKAAKMFMSASLPVVGGMISDAASSVVAGAGILRGAIGAFGMAAVCGICAAPVAALGVQLILFKASAACASALPSGRLSELIDGIADACGMMLGLTGCGAVMLFISIISSARAVTGA